MWKPPNPETFNALVWTIVKQIPEGQVATYGQIAQMIPPPEDVTPLDYARMGARWVGQAMNATPEGEGIPWQRVINSKGEISLPKGSPGAMRQRVLLEDEDVKFNDKGRIDFKVFGWNGADKTWLDEHGFYPAPKLRADDDAPKQMNLL